MHEYSKANYIRGRTKNHHLEYRLFYVLFHLRNDQTLIREKIWDLNLILINYNDLKKIIIIVITVLLQGYMNIFMFKNLYNQIDSFIFFFFFLHCKICIILFLNFCYILKYCNSALLYYKLHCILTTCILYIWLNWWGKTKMI